MLERVGLASIPKALPERPVDEPTIAVHGPLHAAREQRVIVMLWYKSSFVVEGSASKAEGPFGHDGISVDVVRRSLEHEDRRHISDHVPHCMLDVGQCHRRCRRINLWHGSPTPSKTVVAIELDRDAEVHEARAVGLHDHAGQVASVQGTLTECEILLTTICFEAADTADAQSHEPRAKQQARQHPDGRRGPDSLHAEELYHALGAGPG